MDYIGEKCPVCHEEFASGDDIVVCPDCGTPHHRECYKKENRCAHAEKHTAGYKWERREQKKNPEGAVFSICPICHFPNASHEESCARCGARLHIERTDASENSNAQSQYGEPQQYAQGADAASGIELAFLGFDPEEDMGGTTLGEVSSFVATNKFYYLPIFKRMKDMGKKISLNLSCLVFPTLYFANRRMWFWAVFAGLVGLVLSLPSAALNFASSFSEISEAASFVDAVNRHRSFIEELDSTFFVADWALRILYCLFGNWIYFRYVINSIKKLRARGVDGKADPALLTEAGGVRPANMLIIIGIMFGAALVSIYLMAVFLVRL